MESSLSKSGFGNRRIKWLVSETTEEWLKQAMSNPLEILIDHAHCERKAAGFALQMMFRYLDDPALSEVLSPLVREELEHFERVLAILHSRGQNLIPLPAPPYGEKLAKNIRKKEPERKLDSLLVAGLIEARSHERMFLLANHFPDQELRDLYNDLLNSEARHFCLYWNLAEKRFDKEKIILRLQALANIEASILSNLHCEPRMHS